MKNILILFLTFSMGILSAQNESVVLNQAQSFTAVAIGENNFGASVSFINPIKEIKGTVYLFDNWWNTAVIVSKEHHRYLVKNVNINIQQNTIQSKFSIDSLFTFNFSDIKHFVINNKLYKNLYDENGSRIFEIIYESDDFSILKGFHLKLIDSSPNPMINRSNDKYVRKKRYYVRTGTTIKSFKLSKKRILKLLGDDQERIAKIEQYIESHKLSYRKDDEIRKALINTETN